MHHIIIPYASALTLSLLSSQYQDLQEKNEGVLSAFCHQLNSTVRATD